MPEPSATSDLPVVAPVTEPTPPATPDASPAAPSGVADLSQVAPATTPPATPAEPPRPREPVAARISELVGQRARLEQMVAQQGQLIDRQGQQVQQLIEEIRAGRTTTASPSLSASTSDFAEVRPARDSFADPEAYESALIDWSARRTAAATAAEVRAAQAEIDRQRNEAEEQAQQQRQASEIARQQEVRAREIQQAWETRQAAVAARHEDYAEVVFNPNLAVTNSMAAIIAQHEVGPEIAYWLGKNPAEAARIAAMIVPGQVYPPGTPQAGLPVVDVMSQAFEIGKIAARLEPSRDGANGGVTPPAPSSTNAMANAVAPVVPPSSSPPPPPTPISGGSANATARDQYRVGNEGSAEEYASLPEVKARTAFRGRALH